MKLLLSQPLLFCIFVLYLVSLVLLSYDFPEKVDSDTEARLVQLRSQLHSVRTIRTQAEAEFEVELSRLVQLRNSPEIRPSAKTESLQATENTGSQSPEGPSSGHDSFSSSKGSGLTKLQEKEAVAELIKRKREQEGEDIAENPGLAKVRVSKEGTKTVHTLDAATAEPKGPRDKGNEKLPAVAESFPFTESAKYFKTHTSFPIVLLCYNRAEELEVTLQSLLKVRGISKRDILAVQDGAIEAVTRVLQRNGILFLQRPIELVTTPPTNALKKKVKIEPGDKIARHYGYVLKQAFEHFFDAPGVVIVEDDLLFSPDFMEFFLHVAPAIEVDESLWIASAWNDNGFKGVVKDKSAVRRTDHFPGLGWLLMRSIWDEIRPAWPERHWDWFMRNPKTSKGRECVYPEVPRDFHAGSKGSYMDLKTHKKYFAGIDYNKDENFRWAADTGSQALETNYEKRLEGLIKNGVHIRRGSELIEDSNDDLARIVWYKADPHPKKEKQVIPLMAEFHIWHQVLRGARQAVHEFWYKNKKIVLINTFDPARTKPPSKKQKSIWFFGYPQQTKWIRHLPKDVPVFNANNLLAQMKGSNDSPIVQHEVGFQIVGAAPSDVGKSCDYVCARKGLKCSVSLLSSANNCDQLRAAFGCDACRVSYGSDQPSMVHSDSTCLVNADKSYFSCAGVYSGSRRLCTCS